ncbi:DUF1501 domain-containing protein [Pseudoduganella chitinolytica]|uniref:DUF1501 domain-containing protein n=1 Tax=Pseudoduganella chitinolytica TaxID=34070 RepID=A0ABY8BI75_9BURK|nr:DUF1501 domain-containing protein [Pseudoduganella chitinolytica]WEF35671.1 DUF1501 domain-containing protein [Pseudoduganella chitinolytica]
MELNSSRRRFLGSALSLAGGSAMPLLAGLGASANANAASDYKALVCVFMNGGNDAYNTVLATDPDSWSQYQRYRSTSNTASISLPAATSNGGVQRIYPTTIQNGRNFGLHPALGPLRLMFDVGRAAVVANVGTLVQPTSIAEYRNGTALLPRELFSHNDQQSVWQSSQPEGASYGWGGRIGDLVAAGNSKNTFTCISTAENAVFVSGRTMTQYQLSPAGVPSVLSMNGTLFGAHNHPLAAVIAPSSRNLIENEYSAVTRRALETQSVLAAAMAADGAGGIPAPSLYISPITGARSVNPLAVQLQTVARVIAGRRTLGVKRQVFYVSLSGFDTHANQKTRHSELMGKLAHALAYFDQITGNLMGVNMREQVTAFTASDFGRTLVSNGDGTDHGWGGHHFVVGGAVRGHDVYGYFPQIGLQHGQDVGNGALLPNISVDQYGATLARWFGVPPGHLDDVFPNLKNFSTRNLGFMG